MNSCFVVLISTIILWSSGCKKQGENSNSAGKQTSERKGEGGSKKDKSTPEKKNAPTDPSPQNSEFEFVWKKETGIDFVHNSGFDDRRVFPAANGSGLGAIDFDRDGFQDLIFASGKHFPVDTPDSDSPSQVYRNLGDWKFENCSDSSAGVHFGYSTGVAIGDYDNDGFQDIYLGCYGVNVLYRNLGDGSFQKVTGELVPHGKPTRPEGLDPAIPETPGWAASVSFLDYNNDGNLDIYVGNYGIWNLDLKNQCGDQEKNEPRFCSPTTVRPQGDVLYENNGDGTFRDVSKEAGIYTYAKGKNDQLVREDYRTQGVIATDFNDDGKIDIYCGNDMSANLLLINNGNGFENRTELSSTGYGPNGASLASMGVAAGDVNNDGFIDLFCTNFSDEFNSFYKGMGDLQFVEVSKRNRLVDGARPWVGWGTEFIDLDGDGWMEVVVTNGHVDPNIDFFEPGVEHLQPFLIWKNDKGRFKLAQVGGDYFRQKHPGRALAIADLDNDGDQDFVIGHQDQAPALLENVCKTPADNSSVSIQLIGTRSNRDGIGTRLRFQAAGKDLTQILIGGGSYLSSHSCEIRETRWTQKEPAELIWPSGQKNSVNHGLKPLSQSLIVIE